MGSSRSLAPAMVEMLSTKILMTADAVGGVWTYALDLCHGLTAQGAEIALVTFGDPASPDQRAEVRTLPGVTFVETDFKLEWMDDPWPEVDAAGTFLQRFAGGWCPDLVHLNGYAHAALDWPVPVAVVAHSCVYTWWQAVHGRWPPDDAYAEYGRRVHAGLERADAVAAPTAAMLQGLAGAYGWRRPGVVIPNGGRPLHGSSRCKQPHIAAAGRIWDVAKGIATLERIAPRLRWPVHVAGDHAGGAASARPSVENLRWAGRLSRAAVGPFLAESAIFAAPALYEPFGLAILEAARAGCCLVLSDLPSLRENWDGAAEFVPARDLEGWACTLNALTLDDDRRNRLAAAARTRARRFSVDAMVTGYLSLYRALRANTAPWHRSEGAMA
ncbi:MAG TPA: glycosyltransferase family 4 protein [Chthoniobacterales bacterium]